MERFDVLLIEKNPGISVLFLRSSSYQIKKDGLIFANVPAIFAISLSNQWPLLQPFSRQAKVMIQTANNLL